MQKLEAKMQAAFGRWVQYRWTDGPAAFELKRTISQSLPLSAIKEHQIAALSQVAGNGHFFKIPDGGFAQSPFDCFLLKGKSYVVISYGPTLVGFYLIPIEVIMRLRKVGVISITETAATEFGDYYQFPKKGSVE